MTTDRPIVQDTVETTSATVETTTPKSDTVGRETSTGLIGRLRGLLVSKPNMLEVPNYLFGFDFASADWAASIEVIDAISGSDAIPPKFRAHVLLRAFDEAKHPSVTAHALRSVIDNIDTPADQRLVAVQKGLAHESPTIVAQTIKAISDVDYFDDQFVRNTLDACMKYPDEEVQIAAVTSFIKSSTPSGQEKLDALAAMSNSDFSRVRGAVVEIYIFCNEYKIPNVIHDKLLEVLRGPDDEVSNFAKTQAAQFYANPAVYSEYAMFENADLIEGLTAATAVPIAAAQMYALKGFMRTDQGNYDRVEIATKQQRVDGITPLLDSPFPNVRATAQRALGYTDDLTPSRQ